MGRGKLSLNLIPNRKSRSSTFKKRKNSLMKKAYELSTLCDVRACVLIHGPASAPAEDPSQSDAEFHAWPPSRSDIEAMIRAYKNTCASNLQKRKCFDLNDFFSDRRRKVEAEMCKLRENVEETVCPNLEEPLERLSEHELKGFMDELDSKIEAASGMIEFMEADYDDLFRDLSSEDCQNILQMGVGGGDLNPPVMPLLPLDEFDFPDLPIIPNYKDQAIEFNFENLPLMFEENYDNNIGYLTNLMKDGIDYSNNNMGYLMMPGN